MKRVYLEIVTQKEKVVGLHLNCDQDEVFCPREHQGPTRPLSNNTDFQEDDPFSECLLSILCSLMSLRDMGTEKALK